MKREDWQRVYQPRQGALEARVGQTLRMLDTRTNGRTWAMKKTMDCTKPYTGIISRLESLPAQEKPAMAATPSPPRSPCLTVVMMVPLACCRELGAERRKMSFA